MTATFMGRRFCLVTEPHEKHDWIDEKRNGDNSTDFQYHCTGYPREGGDKQCRHHLAHEAHTWGLAGEFYCAGLERYLDDLTRGTQPIGVGILGAVERGSERGMKDRGPERREMVQHPGHYGGDTPHETIKCLEAWGLNDNARLWNAVKYISRAGKKGSKVEDLKKARFYLQREIDLLEASGD